VFAGVCFHPPKWCEICLPPSNTDDSRRRRRRRRRMRGRLREEEQKQEEGLKSFGGEDGEEGGYGEAD
jgi:hypothetical protein